jgi:hypothetical protein
VERALRLAGGLNRFGEPNFRAVWGWNRLAWIGGRWTDRDASGAATREAIELRYVPKYCPHDRWHIERWCAPETYGSPESWPRATLEIEDGQNISALGPYPSRGEYEHVFTLSDARGKFLQLTPAIVDRLARMIERSRSLCGADAIAHGAAAHAARNSAAGLCASRSSVVTAACLPAARQGREALYRREAARDRAYDSWADSILSA